MRPYYEDDHVTLYHGDCRAILPTLAYDVVLTDPPYGNGTPYGPGYQDTRANLGELLGDVMPVLLGSGAKVVALTPGNSNQTLYPEPSWTLAWVIPAGAGRGPWGFSCWQPILVWGRDPYLAAGNGCRPDVFIWTETAQYAEDHPCPKPEKFWRLLLQRISLDPAEVVLDPFAGVGTTLRVAKDLGRRAIGIEQSRHYCNVAISRLGQEVIERWEETPLAEPEQLALEVAV